MQELQLQAQQNMKDHKVKLIMKKDKYQVWECRNPENINYAFEIHISPVGIVVMGDIGVLQFNVYNRSIEFLAGTDVDYYIHSKLDPVFKKETYSKDLAKEMMKIEVVYLFESDEYCEMIEDEDEDAYKVLYDEIHNKPIEDIIIELHNNPLIEKYKFPGLVYMKDLIKNILLLNTEVEVRELIFNYDLFDNDYNLTKPDEGLMYKLYCINYMAKQIWEVKMDEI